MFSLLDLCKNGSNLSSGEHKVLTKCLKNNNNLKKLLLRLFFLISICWYMFSCMNFCSNTPPQFHVNRSFTFSVLPLDWHMCGKKKRKTIIRLFSIAYNLE